MTGAEHRDRIAGGDAFGGDADGGARLAAQRFRRRLRHVDHIGRIDDAHVEIADVGMTFELGANRGLAADQIDADAVIARRGDGAINGMRRRMIATHRVDGYAHPGP